MDDPLGICARSHFSGAMGRITARSETAQTDAEELAATIAESGLTATDDIIFETGRFLAFTAARTARAAKYALRHGLI